MLSFPTLLHVRRLRTCVGTLHPPAPPPSVPALTSNMWRTCWLWAASVLDTPSTELRRTTRRNARRETRQLQASRATTNAYHKEQYVSAYLEAHGAALVHQHATSASASARELAAAGPLATLAATSQELTQLAQELERRYESGAARTSLSSSTPHIRDGVQGQTSGPPSARTLTHAPLAPVQFGAWRSTATDNPRLRRRLHSADVMRHCVIREARTPPALSPEALQRALPQRPPAPARRLLAYLRCPSFARRAGAVELACLKADLTAALRALRYSRDFQRAVALYTLLCVSAFCDWPTASAFAVWLVRQWPALVTAPAVEVSGVAQQLHADLSHAVALFLEATRGRCAEGPPSAAPTLAGLERVCVALHAAFEQPADASSVVKHTGTTHACNTATPPPRPDDSPSSAYPLWGPVVAAPLLALMGTSAQPAAQDDTAHVKALAARFCMHRAPSRRTPRSAAQAPRPGPAYMPELAWGEYLRALHRCGASLTQLQAETDRLTDAAHTRNADLLLSSTHVWDAYLACSPGTHAAEVYASNLRAYNVRETPATAAAVMTALLRDGTTEGRVAARVHWARLQQHSAGPMLARTSSTLVAYVRLLEAEADAAALSALLYSFEDLYECFGVPQECVAAAARAPRGRPAEGHGTPAAPGLDVLDGVCAAHPFCVPAEVRHALRRAVARATETAPAADTEPVAARASASSASTLPPAALELSAEDLAAML